MQSDYTPLSAEGSAFRRHFSFVRLNTSGAFEYQELSFQDGISSMQDALLPALRQADN